MQLLPSEFPNWWGKFSFLFLSVQVSDPNKTTVKKTEGFCINSYSHILSVCVSPLSLSLYLPLCRVLMRNNDVNAWFPGLSQSGIQRRQLFKKPGDTEYIFYCNRAILFLSSSKILMTPHPPLPLASLSSPRNKGGGYTLAGRRGGWGVIILEDERNRIALLQ